MGAIASVLRIEQPAGKECRVPHFFFHIRHQDQTYPDPDGPDLPDLEHLTEPLLYEAPGDDGGGEGEEGGMDVGTALIADR
jgi:hypothetical protein